MTERDLNQEVIDYIDNQTRSVSDLLGKEGLSTVLRSQLEVEFLLLKGARMVCGFYLNESTIGQLAANLTEARVLTVVRINPEAANLGIFNSPTGPLFEERGREEE